MSNNNYFKLGSYNFICDRCGQKNKSDRLKKEWTGLIVCSECYDPRHPVTLPLPAVVDSRGIVDARPRPRTRYVTAPEGLSIWGVQYFGNQGLDPNLTWENWNETWDGQSDPNDFIIGS